jgi:2,4-dienoyl-CoA reductase-like NADH-dependent reductase (Old Yellow Enzyme family)
MRVHISDNQKSKIKQAVEKGEAVSIRLSYQDLQGNDVLAFTTSQLNKIAEAFNNRKGITIKMSKTQVEYNKQIEGGFILPLLGAVASAVLPLLASTVIDRIMGMGCLSKAETV